VLSVSFTEMNGKDMPPHTEFPIACDTPAGKRLKRVEKKSNNADVRRQMSRRR
jgi:hypothetical protein